MNKRAIAILGAIFILIVGTLGFLIYQRSQNDNNEVADQQNEQNQQPETEIPTETPVEQPTEEAPVDLPTRAIKLTDEEVVSPVLFFQGNGITYFNSRGQLFQTDLEITNGDVLLSNKRELTIALKPGISKILWPQTGNNFIAQFGSGTSRTWSFYDSTKGTYTDLPNQITSLDWLPSSDKINLVYVETSGKATLNRSNPDGSSYETLTELYEPDDEISLSPDGQTIVFWRRQNRDARNIISSLDANGQNYRAIINDGYNLGVKWSPDGRKVVFGKRDPQTLLYGLWLADLSTGQVTTLGVSTIPDKVTWTKNSSSVFAAVPQKGTPGNGLTEDVIVKVNLATGEKTEFQTGTTIDGQDLFLDSTENILFFKNAQDRALYYINVTN